MPGTAGIAAELACWTAGGTSRRCAVAWPGAWDLPQGRVTWQQQGTQGPISKAAAENGAKSGRGMQEAEVQWKQQQQQQRGQEVGKPWRCVSVKCTQVCRGAKSTCVAMGLVYCKGAITIIHYRATTLHKASCMYRGVQGAPRGPGSGVGVTGRPQRLAVADGSTLGGVPYGVGYRCGVSMSLWLRSTF